MFSQKTKFVQSEDAVSETIGYSFILGIVVVSVGVMMVIAYPTLVNMQETAFIEAESQALNMLSGRINMVGLGATSSQVTRMDLNGGTMNVYNDSDNWLNISVKNETGDEVQIFNKRLGKLEYTINENTIAFENGGIFRKYPSGDPVMIRPPEFHYNGETLTFPVIRFNNSASAGGKGAITIYTSSANPPMIVYPNVTSANINPIIGKQIRIQLKSDYYKAWARYIEERTEFVPVPDDINHEVKVFFNSKPSALPSELRVPIDIIGIDTTNSTPLNDFILNLSKVEESFHMVLRAPLQNSNDLVIEMQKNGGLGTAGTTIWVSYNKGGYNESWRTDTLALINGNITSIDLLNSSVSSYYDSNDASGTWTNESFPYNRTYIKSGDKGPVNLSLVIQHYIRLVSSTGTFSMYPGTKSGDPAWPMGFDTDGSEIVLDYKIIPPAINYLHIVDHDVNINFY